MQRRVDLAVEHVIVDHELVVDLPLLGELLLGRRVEDRSRGVVLPDVDHERAALPGRQKTSQAIHVRTRPVLDLARLGKGTDVIRNAP